MKYETASSFRTAIEARLRPAYALHETRSISRRRKLMVFDRLLARLQAVSPDHWIVKGGIALEYRLGAHARSTKDLDLARQEDEHAAAEDLRAAESTDLDDFFTFKIDRTDALDELIEGAAVRYRVQAELAGRLFETVTVDVGFSETFGVLPDRVSGPDFLGFAGIQPVEVLVLPLEQHIAEKLHAYTRAYAADRKSSRVKDLVDLVLILTTSVIDAGRLHHAIDRTFASRGTQSLPERFPVPPEGWEPPYRHLANEIGVIPDLAEGYRVTAAFLDPILTGTAPMDARWEPTGAVWQLLDDAN